MNRFRIKICGITRLEDLYASVDAGADALGFIIDVPSSPRNLTLEKAEELMKETNIFVRKVAVTVFRNMDQIIRIYRELKPDMIQIHGGPLSIEEKLSLSKHVPVIRAISVRGEEAIREALEDAQFFDAILADSYASNKYGGTGVTHNWTISRRIRDVISPKPLILAGGLNPRNVKNALLAVKPSAVDVSSGVESKPGVKDREKIMAFIREVRRAEECLNLASIR